MEIRKTLALRGPNVWSLSPALEAWIDLGDEAGPMAMFGIDPRALLAPASPNMPELSPDATFAHALGALCCYLQTAARGLVGEYWTRPTADTGVVRVAVCFEEESLVRGCFESAIRWCRALVERISFDHHAEVVRLRELASEVCLGPSTAAIVRTARRRGIPARRLDKDYSIIVLGQGARQRRIWTAESDQTSVIGERIAKDKELTRLLLREAGVSVPRGRAVKDAADAWAAALEVGLPAVVKPQDGNHGRGVATDLVKREQVVAAYENARSEGESVVVERFAPGDDYRLLVINGQLVAASKRVPAQVLGDGVSTVRELVDAVNLDPRRSDHHATALSRIYLDPVALAVLNEQGLSPDSVPPRGQVVLIRRNANLSTGGTAIDVTDDVHPEVAAEAVEAARVVGLDIAGIDIVCRDIDRPLSDQAGVIVEVNAGPGLRMHLEPSEGKPRPVGAAIVDMLFPPGDDGRIPVVAVTGVNGKTTTTRLVAHILEHAGRRVGMTCTDGITIGGRITEAGDCAGPRSARNVLLSPRVDAAVLECARGGLVREGLGFDACDVGIVTNIGEGDHLGLGGVETRTDLANVKRTVVDAVKPSGTAVLNAADPLVLAMHTRCRGRVVLFSVDESTPALAAHRGARGLAAFVRRGTIILAEGMRESPLSDLSRVPLTRDGAVPFQVENVLAAVSAAWTLGISLETIRSALASFESAPRLTPGRFNVLRGAGVTVVVDYAHNPSAVEALCEALDQFDHLRKIAVFSAAGDRRDADLLRQGEILGDSFDRVLVYETDEWRYDRPEGEIPAVLRVGLQLGNRSPEVFEAPGESEAVATALQGLAPGDLLFIQPANIPDTLAAVKRFLENRPEIVPARVPAEKPVAVVVHAV